MESIKGVVERYVEHGLDPGSGFRHLLEADLNPYRFDSEISANLVEVLKYIQQAVPAEARGSRAAIDAWIKKGGVK